MKIISFNRMKAKFGMYNALHAPYLSFFDFFLRDVQRLNLFSSILKEFKI